MKWKIIAAALLATGCLGFLVAKGISQSLTPAAAPSDRVSAPSSSGSPPLVAQPAPVMTGSPSPIQPPQPKVATPLPSSAADGKPNFAAPGRDGALKAPLEEMTFERLAEELRRVRYRQKELKEQEADLLDKLAQKVEEKRRDYSKAQEELRQLQGNQGRSAITSGTKAESTGLHQAK
jgi:hypothetical protein